MKPTPSRNVRKPSNLWRVATRLSMGFVVAVVGAVVGWVIAATYGGNHATGFELAGLRGYEATGFIGVFVGVVTTVPLSFFLARRLSSGSSGPVRGHPAMSGRR